MTQSGRTQLFLLVLFLLSGAAALVYEVAWQRMLILVFGNTTYATTTVVASFLGGMAAGSFYLGRFADRSKRPLRLYACLEAGIGIFAILSPFIISAMPAIYVGLYRNLSEAPFLPSLARFTLSFLVLLVPSFLMGGTLPVIARFFIQRFDKLGWGVGVLYGVNTLGGVVGAFCAAFHLSHLARSQGDHLRCRRCQHLDCCFWSWSSIGIMRDPTLSTDLPTHPPVVG